MKFRSLISNQIGKPVDARESLINRSTKWIADRFGVSRRTAQRWKAGTQQPSERGNRRAEVMRSADADTRRKVAAEAFRGARAIAGGRMEVKYPGGRVGGANRRNLGTVTLTDSGRAAMAQAADALEAGDTARAEQIVSDVLLNRTPPGVEPYNTSGRSYGPLEVSDWPAGFHLI